MEATEATFQRDVIDRSYEIPVVVDFWASWCGPCRQLGPLLEREVADRPGKVELVKVDTDSNQELSRTFGIQGIPAVKAFKDGQVVSEFVGAQPAAAVAAFLDALGPNPADALIAAGDEASLRQAVELEPTRPDAAVPLARILISQGNLDEAGRLLRAVPGSFAADGLLARLELEALGTPDLTDTVAALDRGDHDTALGALLAALKQADGDTRDRIRRVYVGVLDELGAESDSARDWRRQLAAALY